MKKELKISELVEIIAQKDCKVNLDSPAVSYRKNKYGEAEIFPCYPDLDDVAGMYTVDQDQELLSFYGRLDNLLEDFQATGSYTAWNESFIPISFGKIVNELVEKDLLPSNALKLVGTQISLGNIRNADHFFQFLEKIFNHYVLKNMIATEGFAKETICVA